MKFSIIKISNIKVVKIFQFTLLRILKAKNKDNELYSRELIDFGQIVRLIQICKIIILFFIFLLDKII